MPSESPSSNHDASTRRIGDGPQPPRRPLLPLSIRLLLYPVFSVLLWIPVVRRLRRDPRRWNFIRFAMAAVSVAAGVLGAWWGWWWLAAPGVAGFVMALLAAPSPDPNRERDLQHRHRADYLLNGGRLVSSWPAANGQVDAGVPLYLLLRGNIILAVPVEGTGEVRGSIEVATIEQILVGGESYRPVYISEAKDPPVREQLVDKKAKTVMAFVMAGGEKIELEYEGAFSKHLADTAAHAIYSVGKLGTAHGVAGQSPEIFHIVGR